MSTQVAQRKKLNRYDIEYARSINPKTREQFWGEQADEITWFKKGPRVLDSTNPPHYRWFKNWELNMCYNLIDRHLPKLGNQKALIVESFLANVSKTYTFKELHKEVTQVAGVFRDLGVKAGDRVVIFCPMIGEALFSIYACSRVGAIHSIVFGGFAAKELASRIQDCKPTLIVASSCGLEGTKKIDYKKILDDALYIVKDPKIKTLIIQRPQLPTKSMKAGRDFDFFQLVPKAKPFLNCAIRKADDPLYILYTSGTTGAPKGIVRDIGGTAVACNYALKTLCGIHAGDTYFSTSDIGWVVGHTYIIYGPLLRGAATIIYEGKPTQTPDAASCWKIIEKHKVTGFYTAPTAVRAIRKDDPNGDFIKKYNTSSLNCICFAGERLDVPTFKWFKSFFPKILFNDNYWQTETGWIIASNYMNLHTFPSKPGAAGLPCPGFEIAIVDHKNKQVPVGTMGKIMIKLPLPPSFMIGLYNNDKAFVEKYLKDLPGYYTAGDSGFIDEEGYLSVMARIDDIINTAGHRLSTGQMEEVLLTHKDLVDCAVVSQNDNLKGEVPVGFICVKTGVTTDPKKLKQDCINIVRNEIGPVAAFRDVIIVKALPKTRSGKIIRGVLKKMLDNEPYKVPPTIDDASVVTDIQKQIDQERLKKQQTAKL